MRIIGMIKENDSARYMAHCGESLYEVSFWFWCSYSAKFSLDYCPKCAALIFWDEVLPRKRSWLGMQMRQQKSFGFMETEKWLYQQLI